MLSLALTPCDRKEKKRKEKKKKKEKKRVEAVARLMQL
jgi:hypothetical protein